MGDDVGDVFCGFEFGEGDVFCVGFGVGEGMLFEVIVYLVLLVGCFVVEIGLDCYWIVVGFGVFVVVCGDVGVGGDVGFGEEGDVFVL